MDFKLSEYLRDDSPSIQIDQIGFADLCKLVGADGIQPSMSARFGNRLFLTKGGERVQVKGKNFSAIRIGKSVVLENDLFNEEEGLDALKELINSHVVYYGKAEGKNEEGETVERSWIAFGKKGELVAGKVYSLKNLGKLIGATP